MWGSTTTGTTSPSRDLAEAGGAPEEREWSARSVGVLGAALAAVHLAFTAATAGIRIEHVVADALIVGLPWLGPGAARFVLRALPIWMIGVIFDNQRLWLPLRGEIHTGALWQLEAAIFPGPGGTIWPEYFASTNGVVLDLLAGAAYASYLVAFFGAALWFYFGARDPARFSQLVRACLAANVIALVTYVLVPAAPPWYVIDHGPGPADLAVAGSAAGAARFDALLGISFFESFYARNPNVFGAMPSLHVAYPAMIALLTWDLGARWRVPAIAYTALMSFAAVYLTHHYVLDVIAGWLVALTAALVVTGAGRIPVAPRAPAVAVADRRETA